MPEPTSETSNEGTNESARGKTNDIMFQMAIIAWTITCSVVVLVYVLGRPLFAAILAIAIIAYLAACAEYHAAIVIAEAIKAEANNPPDPDPPIEATGTGPTVGPPARRTRP